MHEITYFKPPQLNPKNVLPYIEEVLTTRSYTKGIHRYELETALADYLDCKYIITTSSGTMSLYIGLKTLKDIYKYDTVIMPSFNWSSDREAAEMSGLQIKYSDINRDTWHLDQTFYHDDKTVVLGLDTFGSIDSSNQYDIIDATHSLGAKDSANRGLISCFSLAATKICTSGEGGFLATNNSEIAKQAIELRDICSRLPEISCILAKEYLQIIDNTLKEKKKIAEYYRTHLPYQFQQIPADSTYSKVGFLCDNSTRLIEQMAKRGIECRRYYKPLMTGLPNSDYVYDHIVCIPSYVGVDYEYVTTSLREGDV